MAERIDRAFEGRNPLLDVRLVEHDPRHRLKRLDLRLGRDRLLHCFVGPIRIAEEAHEAREALRTFASKPLTFDRLVDTLAGD